MRRFLPALLAALAAGCVGSQDDPSQVHDLRVLAMAFEPPEVLASSCAPQAVFAAAATPLKLRALVLDPQGAGRPLSYRLRACANPADQGCEREDVTVRLVPRSEGPAATAAAGELEWDLTGLPVRLLPSNRPLLEQVLEEDRYRGLGGARVPVVLDLSAGDEQVVASKLMVYGCPLVEGMRQNVLPELTGLSLDGAPWPDDVPPRQLVGAGPFPVTADDFSAREEAYVVPSFKLDPVPLVESWRLAWHATLGRFTPNETGGSDFAGTEGKHRVTWRPPPDAAEQDVTFYVVVRDGRGGLTWVRRVAHYVP